MSKGGDGKTGPLDKAILTKGSVTMYKKIMVAVDGSEIAKQALVEAENIANIYNTNGQLILSEEVKRFDSPKTMLFSSLNSFI